MSQDNITVSQCCAAIDRVVVSGKKAVFVLTKNDIWRFSLSELHDIIDYASLNRVEIVIVPEK